MNLSHRVRLDRSPDSILQLISACCQVNSNLIHFKTFKKVSFYLKTKLIR